MPASIEGILPSGMPQRAKASMDVTYLPWAVRSGVEVRPHAFVTGFEMDDSARLIAVLYRDISDPAKPILRRQRARHVFLCAGAIATPRRLLHTRLANARGQVGRNYMAHVAAQVWGTFDEPVCMNKGFPATVISEDLMAPERTRALPEAT